MRNPNQPDLHFCKVPENEKSHAALCLEQIKAQWQPHEGFGRIVWGRMSNDELLRQQEIMLAPPQPSYSDHL